MPNSLPLVKLSCSLTIASWDVSLFCAVKVKDKYSTKLNFENALNVFVEKMYRKYISIDYFYVPFLLKR